MTILLLACSKSKLPYSGEARYVYRGVLFQYSLILARRRGWRVYILSGRYGWLDPTSKIEPYEERLLSAWTGSWPKASGFWIGPQAYFAQAPTRFRPLLIDPTRSDRGYNGLQSQIGRLKKLLRT